MSQSTEDLPPPQKLKLLARFHHLLERLAPAGTERDTAGNREFLYSHYAALILFGYFNPAMNSLRGLTQASTIKAVQKKLGVPRVSRGSFSESQAVFDPQLLVPIVQELLAEVPPTQSGPGPHRRIDPVIPPELVARLVAVDGSALATLPTLVHRASEWKLHLQFRPLQGLPVKATVARTDEADERDVLEKSLESGCIYIADRGYERYALFNRIVNAKSEYVIRTQDRPVTVVDQRPLTAAARAARVIDDAVVTLSPNRPQKAVAAVTHRVRRIVLAKREQGRQRSDRTAAETVVLMTSLVDVPAEVVAAIYELRWSIELFFRFFKQLLGSRRLFSDQPNAVAIQVYCALIAGLLLGRLTGGRVTRDHLRLFQLYLSGWADDDELLAGLPKAPAKNNTS